LLKGRGIPVSVKSSKRDISLKAFLRADGGVAAIEAVFILPFMLLLFFGLIDLTGYLSMKRKIATVAGATADLVGQNSKEVYKTSIDDYFIATALIMKPQSDNDVTVEVFGYRRNAALTDVEKQWNISNGKGPGCATRPSTSNMLPLMSAGNDLVVAQVCAEFKSIVGNFFGKGVLGGATTFSIREEMRSRPRGSLLLPCRMSKDVGASACPNPA
jgi:Flp pilus assembly protein TadG